ILNRDAASWGPTSVPRLSSSRASVWLFRILGRFSLSVRTFLGRPGDYSRTMEQSLLSAGAESDLSEERTMRDGGKSVQSSSGADRQRDCCSERPLASRESGRRRALAAPRH